MRIFEVRHGQTLPKSYFKNDPSLPTGNVGLSPLGEEQAYLTGKGHVMVRAKYHIEERNNRKSIVYTVSGHSNRVSGAL